MTTTVKDHLENCKQVEKLIDDANALVGKLKAELERARQTLEALAEMQHPKLRMRAPGFIADQDRDSRDGTLCAEVARRQIARINELLGDRA